MTTVLSLFYDIALYSDWFTYSCHTTEYYLVRNNHDSSRSDLVKSLSSSSVELSQLPFCQSYCDFSKFLILDLKISYQENNNRCVTFSVYISYPPPTKLGEGNVFRGLCLFTGEGVGISGTSSFLGVAISGTRSPFWG